MKGKQLLFPFMYNGLANKSEFLQWFETLESFDKDTLEEALSNEIYSIFTAKADAIVERGVKEQLYYLDLHTILEITKDIGLLPDLGDESADK